MAFLLGIIISAGIFSVVFLISKDNLQKKDREVIGERENADYKFVIVYGLARDGLKGDIIAEQDLEEYKLSCNDVKRSFAAKEDLVGKTLKINVSKGTVLCEDMLTEKDKYGDDVRLQVYSDISLNNQILEGSIVDIRISFPNGEDYVVAEHKRIISRVGDSVFIQVNEEEILKISSALVDKGKYDGTKIYAILYIEDYQEPAGSDYPVNSAVIELGNWDPNLIERVFDEETLQKRNVLESNLNVIY